MNERIQALAEQAEYETISMNERIQALAEQAGYEKDMFGIGHWDMPECKKFAELIVRECANRMGEEIVYNNAYKERNKAISDMIEVVKQHFGVKE
jgi:CTP:phosphocholine cytidylyltransferase-like protein